MFLIMRSAIVNIEKAIWIYRSPEEGNIIKITYDSVNTLSLPFKDAASRDQAYTDLFVSLLAGDKYVDLRDHEWVDKPDEPAKPDETSAAVAVSDPA